MNAQEYRNNPTAVAAAARLFDSSEWRALREAWESIHPAENPIPVSANIAPEHVAPFAFGFISGCAWYKTKLLELGTLAPTPPREIPHNYPTPKTQPKPKQ